MIINDISVFGVVQQRKTKTQAMILAVLLAATTSAATSGLAHRSPPAAFGAGARPQALWIHGAMFPAPAGTTVCSTSNGCTLGAFIACSDSSQAITNITFASYGDPSECPAPEEGTCSHPDSMKVARSACLGKSNCTVSKKDVGKLDCSSKIASGTDNVIIAATCGDGKERRATNLRYEFSLAGAVSTADATASAIGYHALWCNGERVSARVMEPGRTSSSHVFFSRFDLAPHLRKGTNVIAASLGAGWEGSDGNQPGSTQQPPAFFLDASIVLAAGGVGDTSTEAVWLVSNGSWSSGVGVVTYDSVYQGERRDMRLGDPGWQSSGFDDSSWKAAVVGTTDKVLAEQTRPAVIELTALKPISVRKINISGDCDGAPGCHDSGGGHKDTTCGSVAEDAPLVLSCPNSTISAVTFGQYGTPSGDCPASGLKPGECSRDLVPALKVACVGQESCTLECRSCGSSDDGDRFSVRRDRDRVASGFDQAPPPPPCVNSCSIDGTTVVPSHDPCVGTQKTIVAAVSCTRPPLPAPPLLQKQAFIVDFGQNVAGVVRLKTPSQPEDGQAITVRHCEVLEHPPLSNAPAADRGCYYGELVNALNVDVHTLSSDKARNGEWLQPEFTIHGFRHAEITGLESLSGDDIEAVVIGSNISAGNSSGLRFGSALLQKIQNATVWSHRANTQDIFTDCNQRDERLGWMGDAAISAEAASFNFPGVHGVAGVQAQFLDMIVDGQGDDGAVSDITPTVWQLGAMQPSDASWGSAFPTMAYQVWMTTGSMAVIEKHLTSMVKYIDSLASRLKSSGMAKNKLGHYGDWFPPSNGQKGSTEVVSAGTFIQDTRHVAAMAGAVGDTKTKNRLIALAATLVKDFSTAFGAGSQEPHEEHLVGKIGNGGQTDVGTALWVGAVPEASQSAVVEALVKDIQSHGYHTTSGILGTRSVYEVLAKHGRMDVALAMLNKTSFPSYGFMVDNPYEPSTTLWEKWGASNLTKDQGDASRNHIMFGTISAFFWKHLGGIAPAAAGWTKVRIAPQFGELCEVVETAIVPSVGSGASRVLSTAEATLSTVAGDVHTHWELQDRDVPNANPTAVLTVTVPAGAVDGAEVVMPCVGREAVITEALSGSVVWQAGSFVALAEEEEEEERVVLSGERAEHGSVLLRVPSGEYRFVRAG